jgi:hypothetical protein
MYNSQIKYLRLQTMLESIISTIIKICNPILKYHSKHASIKSVGNGVIKRSNGRYWKVEATDHIPCLKGDQHVHVI